MDAWYPHLIDTVLPQMVAVEAKGASLLAGRYDAPRAQGSAFQEGWFQHMKRVLNRSEEHTSELQSLMRISYAVFCLKKNKTKQQPQKLVNKHINNHTQSTIQYK